MRIDSKGIAANILDLFFPPSLYCICCGNLIDETRAYNLCDHCIRHIGWEHEPPEDRGDGIAMMRCVRYGIYERTLIFSLKYNGKKYIARDIAKMMRDRLLESRIDYDVIVPVPMNAAKERARGFNHAALIGQYLAREMGKVMIPDALRRVRPTRPMRGLSPEEREANIHGSMALGRAGAAERLRGRRVLLLDDFFTTGATARECCRALAPAEPASVLFYAFAARY